MKSHRGLRGAFQDALGFQVKLDAFDPPTRSLSPREKGWGQVRLHRFDDLGGGQPRWRTWGHRKDGRAHLFRLLEDGRPEVVELNIALGGG